MAVTRYVNTASSGGNGTTNDESGDNAAYVSLNAWEAAEQSSLTGQGVHTVLCSTGSGTAADTTAVTIAGWSAFSSSNYIHVKANTGHEAGSKWDDTIYRLQAAPTVWLLDIDVPYTIVEGLQLRETSTTIRSYAVILQEEYTQLLSCFLRIDGGSFASAFDVIGIQAFGAVGTMTVINNIVYLEDAGANTIDYCELLENSLGDTFVYNNTFYVKNVTSSSANKYIIKTDDASSIVKNNIVVLDGCSGLVAVAVNNSGTEDYNAVTDASTTGSNSRNSQTFTFTDAANLDFELASTDTGAKGYGVDLSATFTDDIEGTTRSTPWDIGAVIAAVGGGGGGGGGGTTGTVGVRNYNDIQ